MTLSQIRNQIDSLQRKYARELAIYRLRRQAEEICEQWERAVGDRQDPPQPHAIVRKVADAGHLLPTYMSLHHYVKRIQKEGRSPEPRQIVLALLPWAWKDKYSHLLTCELPALA